LSDGGPDRGELVITNLGRIGSPVVRYRTGDLVEARQGTCSCGRQGTMLEGGVLGRADDMIVVRGINVFPSAIQNIVGEFGEVMEFEVQVERHRQMAELRIRIEVNGGSGDRTAEALAERIYRRLNLRPQVELVAPQSLPRYELKARRFKG